MSDSTRRLITTNVLWFLGAIGLAFVVWYAAITSSNPISEAEYRNIPIQTELDNNVIIVNEVRPVLVNVRAQQDELDRMTPEDIVVKANLRDLGAGTHTVGLDITTSRSAIVDSQPRQYTFELEEIASQQKPVQVDVVSEPPSDFSYEIGTLDVLQAEVSGPASEVNNTVAVIAELDLSDQLNSLTTDVRLVPIDAEGDVVEGVTVLPNTARVNVDVTRRGDVRQVSVIPDIQRDTLPAGYNLSFSYDPQTLFVSGDPEQLENLGATLSTEPIDLTDRTSGFETTVSVILPSDELFIFNGENAVTVSVVIDEQITTRQIDDIAINLIGVDEGLTATAAPESISIVIAGPISLINSVSSDELQAVIDLDGFEAGNYTLQPVIVGLNETITPDNIQILPATINVVITSDSPDDETPEDGEN